MNLLWIATKAPWPPIDGGRLLLWETLSALHGRGHRIFLVAPLHPDAPEDERREIVQRLSAVCEPHLALRRPPVLVRAWIRGALARQPTTLVRHDAPEVVDLARGILSSADVAVDVVVAEQLQAYPQARAAAAAARVPVVVRAQNVESDLWSGAARRTFLARVLLRTESRRLALAEGRMLAEADAVVAVSREDAERLRELGGPAVRPRVVCPPFPEDLPSSQSPLEGSPPLVVLGSAGWAPNRDSIRWFLSELWPAVHRELPETVLHVFGAPRLRAAGAVGHAAPEDSAAAFAPGAVLLVPLRVASGIRMKVLEAWARGVPVIATTVAVRGLPEGAEDAVLLAGSAEELVAALRRLERAGERERLAAAGRRLLRERHDPGAIAAQLEEVFEQAATVARSGAARGEER
ncbi:MAG TPA: glycosyltransferase family 4 protein [Thermoanaerobaculia bacterium]|nr:glycosyltransferase family 4 protein [Thermoanaerobaculia bacterium]